MVYGRRRTGDASDRFGDRREGQRRSSADIPEPPRRIVGSTGHQERVDHVIHIHRVTELAAVAENPNGLAEQSHAQEMAEKSLARNVERHAWAIDIRQAQDASVQASHFGPQLVIHGGGILVNAIEIDRTHGVLLVDRKILRHAIDLARAGVNDAAPRRLTRAFFEEVKLRGSIQVGIARRVLHAVDVADLAGQVEDEVHAEKFTGKSAGITDIRMDDAHARRLRKVVGIGAATGHRRVHHGDLGAGFGQPHCDVAPDKSETAGYKDLTVSVRDTGVFDEPFVTHRYTAMQVRRLSLRVRPNEVNQVCSPTAKLADLATSVCDTGLFDEPLVTHRHDEMQLRAGSTPRRNLSRWSLAVSIPLAAALFYWSARGVDWRNVWQVMVTARPAYLWGAAAVTCCSLFLRAVRWRVLLNAEARLGIGTVFRATMVGYLGNNFLPARAGEVLRSLLISRESELTNTYVLTTALSERLMDVIAVVLAGSLALLGIHSKPAWLADLSHTMIFVAVAGAVCVAVLPHTGNLIEIILGRLPLPEGPRKFLLTTAGQVLLGLRAFHDWGRLTAFAALTVMVWSADGLGVIAGARALHLTVSFPVAMLLLTVMGLGSALPSTPGYVGIYQVAAVLVLGLGGIGRDQALAYSVMAQAVSYVVVTALGLPALYASRKALRAKATPVVAAP